MNSRRKRKRAMILTAVGICLLIIVCSAGAILLLDRMHQREDDAAMEMLPEINGYDTTETTYINETSYNGSQAVDKVMFTIPFQKTQDYVPNKELVKREPVQEIERVAKDFMTTTFGTGYHALTDNLTAYQDKVSEFFEEGATLTLDHGETADPEQLASGLASYYTDNHIQADVSFTTADCLVYQDIYHYVRGRLDVSCYQNDNSGESAFIPEGMDLSKDGSYVVEVALKKTDSDTGYAVAGYSVLQTIDPDHVY